MGAVAHSDQPEKASELRGSWERGTCYRSRAPVRASVARSGAALLLLRHLHRPFNEIEGLFTVLLCIPCLEVRLAQPDTLLGLHDPGQPWEKWGCPIEGCGRWFLGPWHLEGHTAAEHPGLPSSMGSSGPQVQVDPAALEGEGRSVTLSNANALSRPTPAPAALRAATGRSRPSNGQYDDRLSAHPAEELGLSLRSQASSASAAG